MSASGSAAFLSLADGLYDVWIDGLRHDPVPFGGRVDTVWLIQRGLSGDSCQEEGNEGGAKGFGRLRIDLPEGLRVFGSEIRDHLHPGDDDGDMRPLECPKNILDILPRQARIDAAQPVVGPGLEDDDVRLQAQNPLDS